MFNKQIIIKFLIHFTEKKAKKKEKQKRKFKRLQNWIAIFLSHNVNRLSIHILRVCLLRACVYKQILRNTVDNSVSALVIFVLTVYKKQRMFS